MSWQTPDYVRVEHLPSGHVAKVAWHRSQYQARLMCFRILEGKLAAFKTAADFPTHIVRTYDLCADEVATQVLLEGPRRKASWWRYAAEKAQLP
jgi:hypothetical protein